MRFKLGKTPARPPVGLKFGGVFNAEAPPTPPATFGHQSLMAGGVYGVLGNDSVGDCVLAGAAHETMLWTLEGSAPQAQFTTQGVLSDYSAITGYNGTEASDQGTDMQVAAAYRKTTGIVDASGVRHKIQGFASLKVGDLLQLSQAAYLFGAAGVGVQFPSSAEGQFSAGVPWSVVASDTIEGGHYVPLIGRNSAGNYLFVTWGRLQAATPDWVSTYMDEGLCYLSLEMLNAKGVSPEVYDLATLQKDFGEI